MESWIISVIIALIGVISAFAVTKSKVENNNISIKSLNQKIEEHSLAISEHKILIKSSMTMSEADTKFVSKEMFKQMERHMDEKFEKIEKGIDNILKLQRSNSGGFWKMH